MKGNKMIKQQRNQMIKIIVQTYDGPTYTKIVDRLGTPDSGIPCFVDDVVCGVWKRCEVKEVNWRFV